MHVSFQLLKYKVATAHSHRYADERDRSTEAYEYRLVIMPLDLSDFIEQTPGVDLSTVSEESRERINDVLAELTEDLGDDVDDPVGDPGADSPVLVSRQLEGRPGFSSIQDAIKGTNPKNGAIGAKPGDTILVEEGTFEERVEITKPDITLLGSGQKDTTVTGQISVTAPGFKLDSISVEAAPELEENVAVLVTDATDLTVQESEVIARGGGIALRAEQTPKTGTATVLSNKFNALGNQTMDESVFIGPGTLSEQAVTDGGVQFSQTQQSPESKPRFEIVGNSFSGNISNSPVAITTNGTGEIIVKNNNLSDATLLDASENEPPSDQLVSNQSGGQTTVTVENNNLPSPTVTNNEGFSIPGNGIIETADLTEDSSLPDLTASDVANSLVPSTEEDGFFLAFYVPTVVDQNGKTVRAEELGILNDDENTGEKPSIAIPESFDNSGNLLSGLEGYKITLPVTIVWNSTLTSSEFGSIDVTITNGDINSGAVSNYIPKSEFNLNLQQPRGRQTGKIEISYGTTRTPGGNLFRVGDMEMEVKFEQGTRLEEITGGILRTTESYVTPDRSLISDIPEFLSDASDVYSRGLSAAEKATKLPKGSVNKLRKSARFTAFTEVAANDPEIAREDLLQDATVKGITAFADKAREVANEPLFFNPGNRITPAGPTVATRTDTDTVTIENATFEGDRRSVGAFDISTVDFPLIGQFKVANGAVLGTGRITDIQGPNNEPNTSTQTSGGSDSDLEDLPTINNPTNDRAVLKFDLNVPEGVSAISFEYVFGSEEFNEFSGSQFNDVFAFFVNGENVASVPNPTGSGTVPASINNINHGQQDVIEPSNPQLFINNDPHDGDLAVTNPLSQPSIGIGFDPSSTAPGNEPFPTEMDGFTMPLKAIATEDSGVLNPGEPNQVKIAIADVVDRAFDSWVLISANGISTQ